MGGVADAEPHAAGVRASPLRALSARGRAENSEHAQGPTSGEPTFCRVFLASEFLDAYRFKPNSQTRPGPVRGSAQQRIVLLPMWVALLRPPHHTHKHLEMQQVFVQKFPRTAMATHSLVQGIRTTHLH